MSRPNEICRRSPRSWMGMLLIACLAACTDEGPASPPVGVTTPAPAGPSGAAVYEQSKCSRCHTIDEPGLKKLGGPLDGVGSRRDAAWLREYLLDPKAKLDEARMPPVELPEEELEALIRYLLSLK